MEVSWGQSSFKISQPILGISKRRSFVLIALAVAIGSTSPAVAQSSNIEGRVGRLEKEMKAVKRKVFPGGGSQYLEPQIAPAPATPTPAPGTPASLPVADLMARVNALESQLATWTGQTEQSAFKLRQLEEAINKYKDRKRVVEGKSVSGRVDLGGRRITTKKKNQKIKTYREHRQ